MRHVYTILLLVLSIPAQALTIPQGTLYFDNNKTLYNAVCFVYGSDQRQETPAWESPSGEGSKPATWDVSNTQQDDIRCTKVLLDGRIYIQRDGRIYTITGQQL